MLLHKFGYFLTHRGTAVCEDSVFPGEQIFHTGRASSFSCRLNLLAITMLFSDCHILRIYKMFATNLLLVGSIVQGIPYNFSS